ncbi:lipase family protein [Pseudomonas helleri]|uniref:Lipase family protein n=2 Tax=Pseudomonas helleri TaxID=1608996 RepID=A0A7X2C8L2_9PSED|nr:lipase family protein [Pseudomonas helleri]
MDGSAVWVKGLKTLMHFALKIMKASVVLFCTMEPRVLFIQLVKSMRVRMNSSFGTSMSFQERMLFCPVQGSESSFQLTDEFGAGEPYAGLAFKVTDAEGFEYSGFLNSSGVGLVINHFAGPLALKMGADYKQVRDYYSQLSIRKHYPLRITELQVRAEQTRYANEDGSRPRALPTSQLSDADFCQVEVRDLVEHVSHLPPEVERHYPPSTGARRLMGEHGLRGVCIAGNRHTVLQVRPLRALRPMLSTDPQFCALNLYQLALMSTLSYCPFGQAPDKHPIVEPMVTFAEEPSSGNWFADSLAKFKEIWKVDVGQTQAYYPLYEDVAYSRRFEVVPFDPELYPKNNPQLGPDQDSPIKIHFLDDRGEIVDTDTQAFATHSDEIILIVIRGTIEMSRDALRDLDAFQVPFEEGVGTVHRGFYEAAKQAYDFAYKYLEKFYAGQKLLICGHSLGGAIALILSEMLRRMPERYDILLYTYGAPRAGDSTFVEAAKPLVHHRMVNHNDPVPSVPAPWMKFKPSEFDYGAAIRFKNVPAEFIAYVAGMINMDADPYTHHGQLQHFMRVNFGGNEVSHILWEPGCETLAEHAACLMALDQYEGLPVRDGLGRQLLDAGDHSMVSSYVPHCWATLRRWQEAQEGARPLVTNREVGRRAHGHWLPTVRWSG